MWTLSGFADEIDDDLDVQIDLLKQLGLRYLEFRSAWGTNVLDLSDAELERAKRAIDAAGLKVSSIGSPIGKIGIGDDFAPHLDRMKHCADVAHLFEAPFVRIFSFFIPEGDDPASHRDEVLRRLDAIAAVGAEAGITLIHENEKEIYGDIPSRCLDIVTSVDNPALKLTWDNANFVQCGVRPFTDGYAMLRPHVVYVQVKDAIAATGEVVPVGEGDGELRETIRGYAGDGFDGFFSLEPHLAVQHALGGFSGPEQWTRAHAAFTSLLSDESIRYQ